MLYSKPSLLSVFGQMLWLKLKKYCQKGGKFRQKTNNYQLKPNNFHLKGGSLNKKAEIIEFRSTPPHFRTSKI
tara:strand:+ start:2163 stop:2381 length:219 start_codon:yes stop_codon:yes gene_type:complete